MLLFGYGDVLTAAQFTYGDVLTALCFTYGSEHHSRQCIYGSALQLRQLVRVHSFSESYHFGSPNRPTGALYPCAVTNPCAVTYLIKT